MSTIKDIEKATGLSKGTISKYLNGGSVRPQNRSIIEDAIKTLDYHPNENARIVRGGSRRTVAILVPNVNVDYCRQVFLTCQQLLLKRGYGAILYNYLDSPENETIAVNKAIDNNFDAIISLSSDPFADCYRRAKKQSVSVLFIGKKYIPGFHNIVLTDRSATTDVLSHVRKCGHSRIGCIMCDTDKTILTYDKGDGPCLYELCGLTPHKDLMYLGHDIPLSIGYNGVQYLLSLDDPPTVIACLNSVILLGAKTALLEKGYKIPHDISLIGMITAESAKSPVLHDVTCVRFPIVEAAEQAVNIIMKVIDSKKARNNNAACTELVAAEFSACVRWAGSIRVLKPNI